MPFPAGSIAKHLDTDFKNKNVMFYLADGRVVAGTVSQVDDEFVTVTSAYQPINGRFINHNSYQNEAELSQHWHIAIAHVTAFGEVGA